MYQYFVFNLNASFCLFRTQNAQNVRPCVYSLIEREPPVYDINLSYDGAKTKYKSRRQDVYC